MKNSLLNVTIVLGNNTLVFIKDLNKSIAYF